MTATNTVPGAQSVNTPTPQTTQNASSGIRPPQQGDKIGPWRLDLYGLKLVHDAHGYEFDLTLAMTPQSLLFQILQVGREPFITNEDLGHLQRAIDTLLLPYAGVGHAERVEYWRLDLDHSYRKPDQLDPFEWSSSRYQGFRPGFRDRHRRRV